MVLPQLRRAGASSGVETAIVIVSLGGTQLPKQQHEATFSRAVAGLLAGTAFLAAIEPAGVIATQRFGDVDLSGHFGALLYFGAIFFWVTFQCFLLAAVLVIVPIWAFFHSRSRRSWRDAAIVAALAGFSWSFGRDVWVALYGAGPWETQGGDYTMARPLLTGGDWLRMAAGSAVFVAIGAIAGLIMWRVAYRRALPSNN
jgi:hypothetical protein